MSNIYIQEPPTHGKVLLSTSVGDIDIELWSKEAPKACRNFIQLCLESYYDGTIFHRLVPEFIVQGGDPTGTGHGGESIYGKPFKDEFHSRLRFVRRGLVAMANSGPNDNGSQFFFTLGMTPELQNKHTIFGKVSGDTVYNMLKLQEVETDSNERPLFPHKIIKTEVLSNPFDDIVPRVVKKKVEEEGEKKPKSKSKATKNFSLLSFGEEAEEDEEETKKVSKDMKGKSKSSHDLAKDPQLSSVPAVAMEDREEGAKRKYHDDEEDEEEDSEEEQGERDKRRDDVRKKLKRSEEEIAKKEESKEEVVKEKTSLSEELRAEAKKLQKELRDAKKKKTEVQNKEEHEEESPPENDAIAEYKRERQKYKEMRKQQGKKGSEREKLTLQMLAKFQNKLQMAKNLAEEYSDDEEETKKESETKEEEEEEDQSDMSWMCHKLTFETEERKKKVIDANIQDLDRYDVYDPRNPLTKRRREASKQSMKGKR